VYEKAIVTYLDILGFRDIVEGSSPAKVGKILDSLERRAVPEPENDEERAGYQPEVITFSDSIVRVRKIKKEPNLTHPFGILWNEVLDLVHAQGMLIDEGVLVRGGIAFGNISMSGRQVFGPALIDAYDLESKYAQYPRIVLSPYLFQKVRTNRLLLYHDAETEIAHIGDLIRQGDDGIWFIDYARAIAQELDEMEMYPIFLEKHRALIIERSRQFRKLSAILAKYLWLANYHNQIIHEIPPKCLRRYGMRKQKLLIRLKELPKVRRMRDREASL
jgi:hypothetical protein